MFNKHNFEIAEASTEKDHRLAERLGVHITPEATYVTDGHMAIRVSTAISKDAAKGFEPFAISLADGRTVVKKIPKGSSVPLKAAGVVIRSGPEEDTAEVLVGGSKFVLPKLEGRYPDVDNVIPDPGASKFEITFGVELLVDVFKAIKKFQGKGRYLRARAVTLSFTDKRSAVRIDSVNKEGQELVAVVMPMGPSLVSKAPKKKPKEKRP